MVVEFCLGEDWPFSEVSASASISTFAKVNLRAGFVLRGGLRIVVLEGSAPIAGDAPLGTAEWDCPAAAKPNSS